MFLIPEQPARCTGGRRRAHYLPAAGFL